MARPHNDHAKVAAELAARAISAGDVDAAIVAGDIQQELGTNSIPTGAVRRAPFLLYPSGGTPAIFAEQGIDTGGPYRFDVPVHEHVFGLDAFAAEPTALRWSRVYVRYHTRPAAIYAAMRRVGLVPIFISRFTTAARFKDVEWRRPLSGPEGWTIYDKRTRTRIDKPIYVGLVTRTDISGPRATHEWSLSRVAPSRKLPVGV